MSATLDFVAIVVDTPNMRQHYKKLEQFGWNIVVAKMPIQFDDIVDGYYKRTKYRADDVQSRDTHSNNAASGFLCVCGFFGAAQRI